ncbi:MAG TPA: NB-ARC domain-containing protein [Ktedonobacteraceae bacterium]
MMERQHSAQHNNGQAGVARQPAALFCIYEQTEVQYYRELQKYLHPWVRHKRIVWLEIEAGDTQGEVQAQHLRDAQLILFMLSSDFFASDSCYEAMLTALDEAQKRVVRVLPLLARPCAWQETECSVLEPLLDEAHPLSRWPQRDDAYEQIYQKLLPLLLQLAQWSGDRELAPGVAACPAEESYEKQLPLPPLVGQVSRRQTPGTSSSPRGQDSRAFQARELTAEYVQRPQAFAQIKRALLQQPSSEQATAITTALRGAGGFGKTTLALSLCHDPDVIASFPDGIFWLELGEQPPRTLEILNRLLPVLGDTQPEAILLDEARARWQAALASKTCLLVIDDVWQQEHLLPLLEGGPRCRRLITTRNDQVLPANAQRIVVDSMSSREATQLLTQGLSIDLGQSRVQVAVAEVVVHLGYWPLLLSIAHGLLATQLRYGRPVEQALEVVKQTYQDRRGVSMGAGETRGFQETMQVSLQASFRQLEAMVPVHYRPVERYEELAIFPEDTDIPIADLRHFWQATGGLESWEVDDLCMQLHGLSLLVNCDLATGTIRLHDVTRKVLLQRTSSRLPALHARFLDAMRQGLYLQHWAEMATENGYLWTFLLSHFCQAQRWEELHITLTDVRFLAEKARVSGVTKLEADLLLVCREGAGQEQLATWQMLQRRIGQCSHLLRQVQTCSELGGILLAQLGWEPALAVQWSQASSLFAPPLLTALHPLPQVASTALIRTLRGHSDWVNGCGYSPDGSRIVSASNDGTLKVWDAASGEERLTLRGHSSVVIGCGYSADGSRIVSASEDNTLKVWDAASGRCLLTFPVDGKLSCCAFHPDGEHLVAGGAQGVYFLRLVG